MRVGMWLGTFALAVLVGCGGGTEKPKKDSAKTEKSSAKAESTTAKPAATVEAPKPAAASDDPAEAAQKVFAALSQGNPAAAMDASFPDRWVADVDGLVQAFAGKMNKALWDDSFGVVTKALEVIKTKKAFILKTPMLASQGEAVPLDKVEKHLDDAVAVLEILVKSELRTVNKLKKFSLKAFLADTGAPFLKAAEKLAKEAVPEQVAGKDLAALGASKVTVLSRKGDSAMLKIEMPGQPADEDEYVKVEGKWVPKKLADQWDGSIAAGKKAIDEMKLDENVVTMAKGVVNMVDGYLDQLLAAKSQEDFDKVVTEAFQAVGQMAGGGPQGPPGLPPGPPGSN